MGDQGLKCCLGFSKDHVPISWKKNTQQWGDDIDINNWLSAWGRLQRDPLSTEVRGFLAPHSPFVYFGFLLLWQEELKAKYIKMGGRRKRRSTSLPCFGWGGGRDFRWVWISFLFLFRLEISPVYFCTSTTFINKFIANEWIYIACDENNYRLQEWTLVLGVGF